MIWLKNIQAHTLELDAVTVEWDIVDTLRDLAGYTVSVWRSETTTGDFAQVSLEISAAAYRLFRDTSVSRLAMRRQHIYRLRVRQTSDGATLFFGSADTKAVIAGADPGGVPLETAPDLYALEVQRRFLLASREFTGTRALLLRRRSTGQYCPQCFEAETMRSVDDNCETCWGTARAGGYYRPAEFWPTQLTPDSDSATLTRLFELEKQDIVVRASAASRLSPGDLVVFATGERWRVLDVPQKHSRAGAGIWVVAQLRKIVPTDIEHRIPISWDADAFDAVPVRQHLRATDIESYHAAAGDKGLTDRSVGEAGFRTTPLTESG